MRKQTRKVITAAGHKVKLDDFITQAATRTLYRRQINVLDISKVYRAGELAFEGGAGPDTIEKAVQAKALELSTPA
jgi:hypothetical protein